MSDVYLQMDDIVQAFAILDEGIEKCNFDSCSQNLLSQRKEYVLAGMVAIRTKLAENEFDDDGNNLSGRLSEYDDNGNEIKSIYYGAKEKSTASENISMMETATEPSIKGRMKLKSGQKRHMMRLEME